MRIKLPMLIVMSLMYGLPPAFGAATSPFVDTTESQALSPPSTQTSVATTTSQSHSCHGESVRMNPAQDCDGQAASATSVTALLSRLVRSSGVARGVQCPIPPLPDESQLKELHP